MDSTALPSGRLYAEHREVGVTASVRIVVQGLLHLPGAEPAAAKKTNSMILSDKTTQAGFRGMASMRNGKWMVSGGFPAYQENTNGAVRRMLYSPFDPTQSPLSTEQSAATWQEAMSRMTVGQGQTFLLCIAHWFNHGGDESLQQVTVHVNDILAARGLKPHPHGGYRKEDKDSAAEDILTINNIWMVVADEVLDKKGRPKTVTLYARLMDVEVETEGTPEGEVAYAFRLRPGGWARPHLGEHNRMVALINPQVLMYDVRQGVGRMAHLVGVYLANQWRIRAAYGTIDTQPWIVGKLVTKACIPIKTDRRNYGRFRQQFETALDDMASKGVITQWEYTAAPPETAQRGWFSKWLGVTLRIQSPADIRSHYAEIPVHRSKAIGTSQRAAQASKKRGKAA